MIDGLDSRGRPRRRRARHALDFGMRQMFEWLFWDWLYPPARGLTLTQHGPGPYVYMVEVRWRPPRRQRDDLEAYVVQRSSALIAPTEPTRGVPVFEGVGDSVAVYPLLPGKHTFAIWIRYAGKTYSRRVTRTITI